VHPKNESVSAAGFQTSTGSLTEILADLDVSKRRQNLTALAETAVLKDAESAFAELENIPGLADKQAYLKQLLSTWAASDPEAALNACASLPPGELRATAYAAVTAAWAVKSPQEAAEWANTKLTGNARASSIEAIAQTWSQSDPSAAAKFKVTRLVQRWTQLPEQIFFFDRNTANIPQNTLMDLGASSQITADYRKRPVACSFIIFSPNGQILQNTNSTNTAKLLVGLGKGTLKNGSVTPTQRSSNQIVFDLFQISRLSARMRQVDPKQLL
jgi:hypothetical protein